MDERRKADRRQQDQLLTESQVAKMAAVSINTIRHWRQSRVLPSVKVGKHPMIWLSVFLRVFQSPMGISPLERAVLPVRMPSSGTLGGRHEQA